MKIENKSKIKHLEQSGHFEKDHSEIMEDLHRCCCISICNCYLLAGILLISSLIYFFVTQQLDWVLSILIFITAASFLSGFLSTGLYIGLYCSLQKQFSKIPVINTTTSSKTSDSLERSENEEIPISVSPV